MINYNNMINNKNMEGKLKMNKLKLKTFECPICLDLFENPVNDNCGHTFCEECLKECLNNSRVCPISKKKIKSYAPNLILKHLFTQITFNCLECSEDISLEEKTNHKISCSLKKESKEIIIKKYIELLSKNKELEKKINKKNEISRDGPRNRIINGNRNITGGIRGMHNTGFFNPRNIENNIRLGNFFTEPNRTLPNEFERRGIVEVETMPTEFERRNIRDVERHLFNTNPNNIENNNANTNRNNNENNNQNNNTNNNTNNTNNNANNTNNNTNNTNNNTNNNRNNNTNNNTNNRNNTNNTNNTNNNNTNNNANTDNNNRNHFFAEDDSRRLLNNMRGRGRSNLSRVFDFNERLFRNNSNENINDINPVQNERLFNGNFGGFRFNPDVRNIDNNIPLYPLPPIQPVEENENNDSSTNNN